MTRAPVWLAFAALSLAIAQPPLRNTEPPEAIITDLKAYIPKVMREAGVPGLSIALIHGGKIVWADGFGVANTLTREPITPQTVFEVASNSKVVTAYCVLRLVDAGKLSLDRPAGAYLVIPWLPISEYRDRVTLRHLLSHSSGLPHGTSSRRIAFEPGSAFSYSAQGYDYLQAILEQFTGKSLEMIGREQAFDPLAMSSSSFINRPDLTARSANGHLLGIVLTGSFLGLFAMILLPTFLVGWPVIRLFSSRWKPRPKELAILAGLSFLLLALAALWLTTQMGSTKFAWALVLTGGLIAVATVAVCLRMRSAFWSALVVMILAALSYFTPNVPLPKWPAVRADAAGSMRSSAGDLALFALELAHPRLLSPDLALGLRTPQIRPSPEISWGLGPGIQHSDAGDALWQWGQNVDFQSIMVIYPGQDFGVVVCTNSDIFHRLIVFDVAHRALGGRFDGIERASRLEFNRR
jgi:CubicO group peptidase (beta-lactamase class C family)